MARWGDSAVSRTEFPSNGAGRDRGQASVGRSTPGGRLVARMLPATTKAILAGPPKPKVKGVCPDCGFASMKQLPDGRCPDDVACAERAASWADL